MASASPQSSSAHAGSKRRRDDDDAASLWSAERAAQAQVAQRRAAVDAAMASRDFALVAVALSELDDAMNAQEEVKTAAVAAMRAATPSEREQALAMRATIEHKLFGVTASQFASRRDGWCDLLHADIYQCCRPVSCSPAPPVLVSDAFRAFYTSLDSPTPLPVDMLTRVVDLAAVATAPLQSEEQEVHRAAAIRKILAPIFGRAYPCVQLADASGVTGGTLFVTGADEPAMNTEFSTFFGGADGYMQNVQYGVKLWLNAGQPLPFNMFLLTFLGDCFRVEAFWIDGDGTGTLVCAAPLSPFVTLCAHKQEERPFMGVEGAARVLRALCAGLDAIDTAHAARAAATPASAARVRVRQLPLPAIDVPVCTAAGQRLHLTARLHERLVFEAVTATGAAADDSSPFVVKFTRQYGVEAHQRAASMGLAPQLLHVAPIDVAPGWQYLVLENLREQDGWIRLDLIDNTDDRRTAIDELRQVLHVYHNGSATQAAAAGMAPVPQSLEQLRWVHGDLHQQNIMVRFKRKDAVAQVALLDFDWAGREGTARYPYGMNHVHLRWDAGAVDGALIAHEHDAFLVERAADGKGDLITPPTSPAETQSKAATAAGGV